MMNYLFLFTFHRALIFTKLLANDGYKKRLRDASSTQPVESAKLLMVRTARGEDFGHLMPF